jgi:transposase
LLHALLPRVRCPDHGVRRRSAGTVARFAADLTEHGCYPEKVTDTSSDMSTAFISGIRAHLPNARMTFDRYHLAAKLSEAIDTVRREEVATARNSNTPAGCG